VKASQSPYPAIPFRAGGFDFAVLTLLRLGTGFGTT